MMENLSLFDLHEAEHMRVTFPGYRLHKLEVLNWGTFDKKIWQFSPQGETALLTGDVGSGKSTLVDALSTLLIAPRKISYNKAADPGAKERSISTYVSGTYGQKRTAEGMKKMQSLRGTSEYTVLLAVFKDSEFHSVITLAQVYWFTEMGGSPHRMYVTAEKALEIEKDFSGFKNDMRLLKKRLRETEGVFIFDDYTRYSHFFCQKFNIGRNALDLFQQTISMKKVEAFTDFVRANMLDTPNTQEDVDKLIRHFHDLNSAHQAVVKTRKQVNLLTPLVEKGTIYTHFVQEHLQQTQAQQALPAWFATQTLVLLAQKITATSQDLALANDRRQQAEMEKSALEKEIKTTEREIITHGGDKLESAKGELVTLENELQKISQAFSVYELNINKLGLQIPSDSQSFYILKNKLPDLRKKEAQIHEKHMQDNNETFAKIGRIKQELINITRELESLRARKSSIPSAQVNMRNQLCQALNIDEEKLPFVGELLEVRENAPEWEGAIERLVRGFGLSMLVPDNLYDAVMRWVDKTPLGMRLVYYRVNTSIEYMQKRSSAANTIPYKLIVSPESPFYGWVTKELFHRFPHVCCENVKQFQTEEQGITMAGQIKAKGGHHEKDDRHNINDRTRFILGFSNDKKIKALESDEKKLTEELNKNDYRHNNIKNELRATQARISATSILENMQNYADIDTASKENEILIKKQLIHTLEQENDVLKTLNTHLATLNTKMKAHNDAMDMTKRRIITLENNLTHFHAERANKTATADSISEAMREDIFTFLHDQHKITFAQPLTLDNEDNQSNVFMQSLSTNIAKLNEKINKITGDIVRHMQQYKSIYPEQTHDITADVDSMSEYNELLTQLENDGLPQFETRFQQLLCEGTLNNIILLQTNLTHAHNNIKERIKQINHSLSAIDYNDGRYIRLEHEETNDNEIKSFRVQLKSCTEMMLGATQDTQFLESKFAQIKEIIDRFIGRPDNTEGDHRWTKKVIDVRNWFQFAASERWRETDVEYEHYKDSSGKSGGQKEKLAYTILAASLVYNYGLEGTSNKQNSFRFVVIDEAFLKSSDESARFGLELFKKLDLQLLIVTPLLKIPTIEPFIGYVGFVHHDDVTHRSMLRTISIDTYRAERKVREGKA
ncbi:MAG: hypothetical protein FWC16_03000 [Defluviitaleaceae bacterium]|nr:hypothetical protein [Defluviitaleaceae bacterium]MCL2273869.1 hypothetical protein [Defluviitaleaceae bacterium]